jgi:ribosomal protein S28E/S33
VRDAASLPFAYGPTDESATGYRYVLEPLCAQHTSATCDIFFGRSVTVGQNGEDGRSHHVAVKVLKGQDAERHLVAELKGRLRVPGGFASDELWREALDLVYPDPGAIPVIPQTGTAEGRIVPVLDFGLHGRWPNERGAEHGVFLVLPKKDGTLLDSLQRERWAGREVERVRDMAKQLAEALSACTTKALSTRI